MTMISVKKFISIHNERIEDHKKDFEMALKRFEKFKSLRFPMYLVQPSTIDVDVNIKKIDGSDSLYLSQPHHLYAWADCEFFQKFEEASKYIETQFKKNK